MTIEEANNLAKKIINEGFVVNANFSILGLKGLAVKSLETKESEYSFRPCIAVEFYKPLHKNIYFTKYSNDTLNQTYLEILYNIKDTDTGIDAQIEFDFDIKDSEKFYQYSVFAESYNNRSHCRYHLSHNVNNTQNLIDTVGSTMGDVKGAEFKGFSLIGIYNNRYPCSIEICDLKRFYYIADIQTKDYNFSDTKGAFPSIMISGDDIFSNKIEYLKIGINYIALSFYKIDEIKTLELTFNSDDKNREEDTFKDYINYRLKTDYIQNITNIALQVTIWNLELAFNDYLLIKHHKLFTILTFRFNKKYLGKLMFYPINNNSMFERLINYLISIFLDTYDKLYVEDKIKLYSALHQQAKTVEQKLTLHRYIAYYSSRLDRLKRLIFWITEDYNNIKHPVLGLLFCVFITTCINTVSNDFDVISITNISDIFKYRFNLSCAGFLTFMGIILSIVINTAFGYLLFALSIAIKRRFGMGNSKDMD